MLAVISPSHRRICVLSDSQSATPGDTWAPRRGLGRKTRRNAGFF